MSNQNTKLSKRDQGSLLSIAFLIIFVVLVAAFYLGSKMINPLVLGLFVLILEHFILTPTVCKLYYQVNNLEPSLTCYIPLWGEIQMFSGKLAVITLVSEIITVVLAVIMLIGPSTVFAFAGMGFALHAGNYIIGLCIVALVLTNVFRGLGLFSVIRDVDSMIRKVYKSKRGAGAASKAYKTLQIIIGFVPIARSVTLVLCYEDLVRLVRCNQYNTNLDLDNRKKMEEVK